MNKLKTLGEITSLDISLSGLIPSIREEAMRWIAHIKKDANQMRKIKLKAMAKNLPVTRIAVEGLDEILEGQIKWIKLFFNITDEELKFVKREDVAGVKNE